MDTLHVVPQYGHRRSPSGSSLESSGSNSTTEYSPSTPRHTSLLSPRTDSPLPSRLLIQQQPEYIHLMKDLATRKRQTTLPPSSTVKTVPSNPYLRMRTPVVGKPQRRVTFTENTDDKNFTEDDRVTIARSTDNPRASLISSNKLAQNENQQQIEQSSLPRPRTAVLPRSSSRNSLSSIPSASSLRRPKSADPKGFDAERDFPDGIGTSSPGGMNHVTMHMDDLQRPGKIITITMSYSAATAHNARIYCDDIIRTNKRRERAMKLLIKEIETRLTTQQKNRDGRVKQREEEEERERKREEKDKNGRRLHGLEKKDDDEDTLKRRDVSLLTMTDVKQLRKKRISRLTKLNTRYSTLSRDQIRKKNIYSQSAVL